MCKINFHNFYQYDLSTDDAECIQFLLSDFLLHWDIFQMDNGGRIQDFVFLLIRNGLTENETLNVIIESLYFVPRLDILYECSISYDSYISNPVGKLICNKRLLFFNLFNELEEKDFKSILHILWKEYVKDEPWEPKCSILQNLDKLLKMSRENDTLFDEIKSYFSNFGNNRTKKVVDVYEENRECTICDSEQLWQKVSNDNKQSNNDKIIIAMEKGDEFSNPSFAINDDEGRMKLINYKADESYLVPERDSIKSFCLIFDIRDYENKPRKGSEKDILKIRKTFEKLHFTIQPYKNVTKSEMFDIAKTYANIDAKSSGSMLVCFILAHGSKDCIFDINEEKVNIRQFSLCFSAKNCEAYRNKPKVFFIQACQGDRFHEGIPETSIDLEESSQCSYLQTGNQPIKIEEYKKSDMIPEEADFIYGMATVSDYVAFRSTKKGSWYITELCKRINEEVKTNDVIGILTNVNGDVSRRNYKNKCQLPSVIFTTRKKCYLTEQTSK
uniref:Caspase-8 n=1 Tax=Dugesia japonica TaxID=6161 RepID=A0A097ZJ82_DUGJA|nr:caspase-8 [Dugesia japonica]